MPDGLRTDLGRERLDVDDDDVDRADAVLGQLGELGRDVAPGEDAGVDRWVERLDLPADERRDRRQVGDRPDLDPIGGEMLAGAVGGEHLDAQTGQVAGEGRHTVAVRDREQGSHPGPPPDLRSTTRLIDARGGGPPSSARV